MGCMSTATFDEFMETYNVEGRPIIEVDVPSREESPTPFIIVRHGRYTAVVNPMPFKEYLDIDIHSFIDGKDAKAGVMGMTAGTLDEPGGRYGLEETGVKVEPGWNAASLIAVFIGDER